MKNKQWLMRLISVILPIAALTAEFLPGGAVLNFASPEGAIQETFPYFSLLPFGYGNFGPLLTAVLTCVLLLLSVLYALTGKKAIFGAVKITAILAAVVSLLPLCFGLSYFSAIGGLISLLLIVDSMLLTLFRGKRIEKEERKK